MLLLGVMTDTLWFFGFDLIALFLLFSVPRLYSPIYYFAGLSNYTWLVRERADSSSATVPISSKEDCLPMLFRPNWFNCIFFLAGPETLEEDYWEASKVADDEECIEGCKVIVFLVIRRSTLLYSFLLVSLHGVRANVIFVGCFEKICSDLSCSVSCSRSVKYSLSRPFSS